MKKAAFKMSVAQPHHPAALVDPPVSARELRDRSGFPKRLLTVATIAAAVCAAHTVRAADEYYRVDGTTSTWTGSVWSLTGASPYTSAWTSGNNAIFTASSSITGAATTVGNITAQNNVTVSGSGTMTLSNTTLSVSDGFLFNFASQSFAAASSINKTGNGTLQLTGSAYTGGFTLTAGTVNIGGTNALGTGTLTINGGTLQGTSGTTRTPAVSGITIGGDFSFGSGFTAAIAFTPNTSLGTSVRKITVDNTTGAASFSGVISGVAGGINKAGLGELDIGGTANNTYNGLTTVSAGTLGLNGSASINAFGGDLTISGGSVIYSAATNNQIPDAAKVSISSGSLAVGARTETIGATATSGSGLAVSGTGAITIASGTLNVANSAAMTGGSVIISSSGTLQTNTNFVFSGGTIDSTYTGATAGGLALRGGDGTGLSYLDTGTVAAVVSNSGGGANRLSLNTVTNSATVFNIADSPTVAVEMLISAPITGTATGIALQKTGAGILELAAANTYVATTAINGGLLRVSGTETAGTSGPLGKSGTISFGGGTLQYSASNQFDYSSRFSTAAGQAYSVNTNGQAVTFATALTSSGATLVKSGAGTLILTGDNTFAGATTINGGTLNAASTTGKALGASGPISVNNGGTLLLSTSNQVSTVAPIGLAGGTISRSGTASQGVGASRSDAMTTTGMSSVGLGVLSLTATSTLDFGTSGVGTLVFTDLTRSTNTVLNILNFTTNASGYNLDVSGVDGTDDRLIFSADQSANLAFFSFGGGAASQITLDSGFYEIVPAPEPATVLGGLLTAGLLGYRLRRRLTAGLTGSSLAGP